MTDRGKRFEQHGPDGPFDDRTGNEMLNNGPHDGRGKGPANGPDHGPGHRADHGPGYGPGHGSGHRPGYGPGYGSATGAGHGPGHGPDHGADHESGHGADRGAGPLGPDEQALRRLLQGAVQDLEPSEQALDHLRRAIPTRRARKRQALVGVAAAALLVGTAVPAFVHVATSSDSADARAVKAGHGEDAQDGTGAETGSEGGERGHDRPSGDPGTGPVRPDGTRSPQESATGTAGTATGGTGAVPPNTVPVTSPTCEPGQLGVKSAQTDKPDAQGRVYGTFRISNVSGKDCAVSGAGTVGFQVAGAANASKINVVEHTAGDAASGLPDPSSESRQLLLKPSTAYEVKFAWVPTETCPTPQSPDPSTPAETGGTTSGSTGSGSDTAPNTQTQLDSADGGGPAEGSVSVTHTAEPGAPSAEATIPNACAGTIYRTGVLNAE
ncbi:hypothetical protein ABT160_10410 [Streptomyces sp. NPDC001941]|uniref:hypothetical protein n=1 Tax=Streptomyces sp. NPDC001941 TaxID=3154659 RepID=UPI00331F41DD